MKGWIGEQKTKFKLWLSLSGKTYHKFHNIILPSKSGTTQIDHIIVSIFGVFIIETKNYTGWIFGSADQAKWTQVIYNKKYSFQNPLRQTYRQKKALSEFLKIPEYTVHPLVYFVGQCRFKATMPENVLRTGLFSKGAAGYIKGFKAPVFTQEDVDRMVLDLKVYKSRSSLTSKHHLRSLQERHAAVTHCPKCGSDLIVRTIKKGSRAGSRFLGCSTFPKCRYTREFTPEDMLNPFFRHPPPPSKTSAASTVKASKPPLKQWLQDHPNKSINDYYVKFGR